jgi:hypothetical protein
MDRRINLEFQRVAFTVTATGKRVDVTRRTNESAEDFARRLGDAVREAETPTARST